MSRAQSSPLTGRVVLSPTAMLTTLEANALITVQDFFCRPSLLLFGRAARGRGAATVSLHLLRKAQGDTATFTGYANRKLISPLRPTRGRLVTLPTTY